MAHPIPQKYKGSYLLPIQPGNDVLEKLCKHLVVNRFIAAHSVFNIQFSNDLLMVYSKTRI